MFTVCQTGMEIMKHLCCSVSLIHGRYPEQMIKQWDIFHQKKGSENDRPGGRCRLQVSFALFSPPRCLTALLSAVDF